jgi:hypothetical protein
MRIRLRGAGGFDTRDSLYAKSRVAEWLMRLSDHGAPLSDSFFACLQWCTPLKPVMRVMAEIIDKEPEGSVSAAARESLQDTIKEYGRRAARNLEELLAEYPCLVAPARESIKRQCRIAARNRGEGRAVYARRRARLKNILGLSREAVALCDFIFIEHSFEAAENYFENSIGILQSGYRELLAVALGIDSLDLQKAFSDLMLCGLIEDNVPEYISVSGDIFRLMRDLDVSGFLYQPVGGGKILPLESFSVQEGDLAHVKKLLKTSGDEPIHIIFYGPPGTGKTTCARSLAHTLNVKAWSVPCRIEYGHRENCRRTALTACMKLAGKHRGAFVL